MIWFKMASHCGNAFYIILLCLYHSLFKIHAIYIHTYTYTSLTCRFPSQRPCSMELRSFLFCLPEQSTEQTAGLPVIWDVEYCCAYIISCLKSMRYTYIYIYIYSHILQGCCTDTVTAVRLVLNQQSNKNLFTIPRWYVTFIISQVDHQK